MGQGLQEPQGISWSTLTFSGFYLQSTISPISLKILIKMVTKPFLSLPISNQTTLLPHICSCPAWNHILSSGSWCWRGMMKKQRLFVNSSMSQWAHPTKGGMSSGTTLFHSSFLSLKNVLCPRKKIKNLTLIMNSCHQPWGSSCLIKDLVLTFLEWGSYLY